MDNNIQYSQGLFETFIYNGDTPSLERHLKRLNNSSKELFDIELDLDNIKTTLNQYTKNTVLKLLVAYDETKIFYEKPKTYKVYIKNREKGPIPSVVSLTISPYKRHSKDITIYHKTTNYLLNTLAKRKAQEMGFFDGIFLNENDDIQECSSSNILFEKDGKYYSPYIQSGILFGITLQTLKDHLNIEFLPIKAKDLKEFERAFILNSVIGVKSIKSIDNINYKIDQDLEYYLNSWIEKENS
jgi:Branched-chain amino acid aminotransferase/4-amino-4-deoxychorismate lyase